MSKVQIDTEHVRKMADDYSYVIHSFVDAYTAQKKGVKICSRPGNHMLFSHMRGRQTLTLLSCPELKETVYEISRIVGESIISNQTRGKTLPGIIESNRPIVQRGGYIFGEAMEVDETYAVYRHYECAGCYDLLSIYSKICVYEAGMAVGTLFTALGEPRRVAETKRYANDNSYCEFLVEVL